MFKIAVIWLGTIWKHYCTAVENNNKCVLSHIVDIEISTLSDVGKQFPNSIQSLSYQDIPREVDVVCIATPNISHYEISKRCIENDIHVLCEKPSTTILTDTQDLIEYAILKNKIFKTAYHRSYNKYIKKALNSINRNEIQYISCKYFENIKEHITSKRIYNKYEVGWWCIIDNWINVFDVIYKFIWDFNLTHKSIVRDDLFENEKDIDVACLLKWENHNQVPVSIELDRRFQWEEKTVTIWLLSWKTVYIDMLKDYVGFKSSLEHEYAAIIEEMCQLIFDSKIDEDKATLHHMKIINEIYTI